MGLPIARHLARAGNDVAVYDADPDRMTRAAQSGMRLCAWRRLLRGAAGWTSPATTPGWCSEWLPAIELTDYTPAGCRLYSSLRKHLHSARAPIAGVV